MEAVRPCQARWRRFIKAHTRLWGLYRELLLFVAKFTSLLILGNNGSCVSWRFYCPFPPAYYAPVMNWSAFERVKYEHLYRSVLNSLVIRVHPDPLKSSTLIATFNLQSSWTMVSLLVLLKRLQVIPSRQRDSIKVERKRNWTHEQR